MRDFESLPGKWKFVPLSSVVNIVRGVTYKKKDSSDTADDGLLPILRANNIQNDRLHFEDLVYVPKGKISESQKIKKGDIVVAMSSGSRNVVGKTARATEDWIGGFGAFCGVLRPLDFVSNGYIGWFTSSGQYRLKASNLAAGVNINNLKPSHFDEIKIPVPPLAEQKQIVAKLNELLAQVDAIKARVDAIPGILKRFRRSVLAAAVSGRLTKEWRKNNEFIAWPQLSSICRKNPVSKKRDFITDLLPELPADWCYAQVKEVGQVQLGRQRSPKYHTGENMRPYLRVMNVKEGYIDTSDIMEMVFDDVDYKKYELSPGDILLNEGQSHELIGRPAIYRGEVPGACFTNTLIRFRPYKPISSGFCLLVFLSQMKSGRFQEIASRTVNISHLGAGRFADLEFPFPPFEEQTEIVRQVDQLFAFADNIEKRIKEAQNHVNQLTQSILAKAFRGDLTAEWREQNPHLITGENSAEALLNRIKAERAAKAPKKKTRKRRAKLKTEKV